MSGVTIAGSFDLTGPALIQGRTPVLSWANAGEVASFTVNSGRSMTINYDGTVIAVTKDDNSATNADTVDIFRNIGGNTWQRSSVTPFNFSTDGLQSRPQNVAMTANANTIYAGSPTYDGSGKSMIYTYLYNSTTNSYYYPYGLPVNPVNETGQRGASIAISCQANVTVTGSPNFNSQQGYAAYSNDDYGTSGILPVPTGAGSLTFWGRKVAVSADGTVIAVGGGELVQMYSMNANGTYALRTTIAAPEFINSDFGYNGLALNANGSVLNVSTGFSFPSSNGKVYRYIRSGNAWSLQSSFTMTGSISNGGFGLDVDVAANGRMVVCGGSPSHINPSLFIYDTPTSTVATKTFGANSYGFAYNETFEYCRISGDGNTIIAAQSANGTTFGIARISVFKARY